MPLVKGAKLTPILHVPPAGTPVTQVLLARLKNCPVTCGTVIASIVLLLLCKVIDLVGAFPVLTFPKLSDVGVMVSFTGGGLGVGDAVGVIVMVAVGVAVSVGVAVAVGVSVAVAVGVSVAVAVAVAETVAVAVGVSVVVTVAVVVGDAVIVAVGVAVGDALKVAVAVPVGVALAVGVGEPAAAVDSNAPISHAPLLSPGSGRGSPR